MTFNLACLYPVLEHIYELIPVVLGTGKSIILPSGTGQLEFFGRALRDQTGNFPGAVQSERYKVARAN